MSRLPVAAMPSTCQVSFTSTWSTGTRKLRERRADVVAVDLPAEQHPVGVADAGAEGPVAREPEAAVGQGHREAGGVHAARGEHVGLGAEHLVLQLVGEHREEPVVLHVEGGDPAHRRIGPGHGEADVDEGLEVDLVAAVAGRARTTGTRRWPSAPRSRGRAGGVAPRPRPPSRRSAGRAPRRARRARRAAALPRAHDRTIPAGTDGARAWAAGNADCTPSTPHAVSTSAGSGCWHTIRPCRDFVRSPGPRWSHRWSCPCTTASSATATRSPSPAPPPARPATGGRCSPTRPT